jgi:hypothetical protein
LPISLKGILNARPNATTRPTFDHWGKRVKKAGAQNNSVISNAAVAVTALITNVVMAPKKLWKSADIRRSDPVWKVVGFIVAGALIALVIPALYPAGEYPGEKGDSQALIVSWIITVIVIRYGVVAGSIAVLGASIRAAAHGRDDRKGMDFLGKLLAVAAGTIALLGAWLTIATV